MAANLSKGMTFIAQITVSEIGRTVTNILQQHPFSFH